MGCLALGTHSEEEGCSSPGGVVSKRQLIAGHGIQWGAPAVWDLGRTSRDQASQVAPWSGLEAAVSVAYGCAASARQASWQGKGPLTRGTAEA